MKTIIAAFLAVVGIGCASVATQEGSSDVREVAYSCANGESLSVRFSPLQDVAILTRNGEQIELQRLPSASGFIYSNGPNTIRGKGNDLRVEIGRMAPIQCQAG